MITIKPHHFLDIIKLYGAGIENFVPDENRHHDFYKVANQIIHDQNTQLKLTIHTDDICEPCRCHIENKCIDELNTIEGYDYKDDYNHVLDNRMIKYFHLDMKQTYTAYELCTIYYKQKENIMKVWIDENTQQTQKRYDLFCLGAQKYINLTK